MTLPINTTTRIVTVPGARLHYEMRGSGPLLLVIGSPMSSAEFAPVAGALAGDHTVVTYDPRGHANSTIDDPDEDATAESRADDIAAILDDLRAESADVFGSSGGAVTGLALVVRHPGRVRTLVAHEPPLLELLPDAAQQRANTEDIIDTFHTSGLHAAWYKFMLNAGFDMSAPDGAPVEAPPQPSDDELKEAVRFFDHELRPTTRYLPDIETLKNSSSRVLVGLGVDSGALVTHRTSTALAQLLGSTPVEFPGDHGGFLGAPGDFARRLTEVLRG
ncbi:alpha/beta hydrolase [Mycobacterium sp.]|uniref:alpha/beta fold hydrolase n=1 Tax=Mycobacterium sp. TaxID=1785 RepID=UPI002CB1523C|nr:alpha/beta hydrolase [Mycobacterium sp.]HKP44947.1 alpha/beta hydrolase [Mycobacterium sp.]